MFSNCLVMIGKQLINNLFEFVSSMSRSVIKMCPKRGETDEQEQWEKDNELRSFNSNTLIDEYLELGNRTIFFNFIIAYRCTF